MNRLRNVGILACVAAGGVIASACSSIFETACAGVGYYAIRVSIVDRNGSPQAIGAVVTLTDGAYQQRYESEENPQYIGGAGDRGGPTYDVHVAKPYYGDVVVRAVRTPDLGCVTGSNVAKATVTVPIVITSLPDAPPIRAIHLLPRHIIHDRGRAPFAFETLFDADLGTSRAVTWSIAGDTASVGFDAATGILTYRCLPKSGYVTVTARAVANPSVFDTITFGVQGHPAATTDPPCS